MSQYKIEAGTGAHIGDRSEQQDRAGLFVAPKAPGYMMAVLADGMGAGGSGALAAEQVVRTAQQNFERFSPLTDTVEGMLETICREAHTLIRLNAFSSDKRPHSTMTAMVITPGGSAIWAHVGDSRLYRFDGPNCANHTNEQPLLDKLVRAGKLTPADTQGQRLPNVLVNLLGHANNEPYLAIGRHDNLKAGDAFLLCSDGLWLYFSPAELGAALAMNSPRMASEMLITKARERAFGSIADNCTMAIVKLVKPPEEIKDYTVQKIQRAV